VSRKNNREQEGDRGGGSWKVIRKREKEDKQGEGSKKNRKENRAKGAGR